jgi:hypothetical protein
MLIENLYTLEELHQMAKALFAEERGRQRLDGWFLSKEIGRECDQRSGDAPGNHPANTHLHQ